MKVSIQLQLEACTSIPYELIIDPRELDQLLAGSLMLRGLESLVREQAAQIAALQQQVASLQRTNAPN